MVPRLLRLCFIAWLLFFAAARSQAVVSYAVNLYNATGHRVELVNEKTRATWATIEPGHSKSLMYFDGVTLRCSGRQLHYTRVDPPKEYISTGLSSVTFKAQLGSDLRIYLLSPSSRPPVVQTPSQPKGFPLSPKTRRSNQTMQPAAGRRVVSLHFMKTIPLQFTFVSAADGLLFSSGP